MHKGNIFNESALNPIQDGTFMNLLEVLENRITGIADERGGFDIADYTSILNEIGSKDYCKMIIESILADESSFNSLFNRFYHHQNGFDKLILIDSKKYGWKLRLHIWWEEAEDPDMYDIHDHSADFASKLIIGGINNQIYIPSEGGRPYYHYKYAINHNLKTSTFFPSISKQVGLELSEEHTYNAGDVYTMRHEVLHKAQPVSNQVTATIVIKAPDAVDLTSVYKEDELATLENISLAVAPSKNDFRRILTNLKVLLYK